MLLLLTSDFIWMLVEVDQRVVRIVVTDLLAFIDTSGVHLKKSAIIVKLLFQWCHQLQYLAASEGLALIEPFFDDFDAVFAILKWDSDSKLELSLDSENDASEARIEFDGLSLILRLEFPPIASKKGVFSLCKYVTSFHLRMMNLVVTCEVVGSSEPSADFALLRILFLLAAFLKWPLVWFPSLLPL